jgi:phage portal protein BeeE
MSVFTSIQAAFGYGTPRPDFLASPFTEGQLQKIVFSDVFGTAYAPITRAEAMTVPALSKARNLICATIANLPLIVKDKDGVLATQPEWTYRTDGTVSPFMRMLWTLDDLLFYGRALWLVTRGAEGQVLDAERVPIEAWKVTHEGAILVNDEPVDALDVVYFPAPIEGLLDKDASSLRSARSVAQAVEARVKSPIPVMELHATGIEDVLPAEAKAIVTAYNTARRDPEGATVFTPASIEMKPHGDKADSGFMVEGRNAVRLDVANMTGVPVALLDGSTSTASLTYSTQEGRRNEFVDYSLVLWTQAILGRLSSDDIVAPGLHVEFDQTNFLTTIPALTGAPKED